MRIKQAYIRPSMRKAFDGYFSQWGLGDYRDPTAPAVFYGCYDQRELSIMRAHEAQALVVWMGSDFALQGNHRIFRDRAATFTHVANSKWLEKDLKTAGLPYCRINLVGSPLLPLLEPKPLGRSVYCYMPVNKEIEFGQGMLDEVMRRRPWLDFIVRSPGDTHILDMPDLYADCCIGLRFTQHDGVASTVIELGYMGRRCVHNGDAPNAVSWAGIGDVLRAIDYAASQTGKEQDFISRAVRGYVQTDDSWLEVA